jgi:hypothetical protein
MHKQANKVFLEKTLRDLKRTLPRGGIAYFGIFIYLFAFELNCPPPIGKRVEVSVLQ